MIQAFREFAALWNELMAIGDDGDCQEPEWKSLSERERQRI